MGWLTLGSLAAPYHARMQSPTRRAAVAGLAGALLVAILAGPVYLTAGLLVVAGLVGWGVGLALRGGAETQGRHRTIAVGVAPTAVVLGLLGAWAFSLTTGGMLDPLGFVAETMGLLAPLQLLIAGAVAARTAG